MKTKMIKHTYSLLDEMMASPTHPGSEKDILFGCTRVYEAINAIERDPNPDKEHWQVLCDTYNMMEVMCYDMGLCEDTGLLAEVLAAMKACGGRLLKGQPLRFTADDMQAIRAMAEDFTELRKTVPERTWVRCHRMTEKALREARAGRRHFERAGVAA